MLIFSLAYGDRVVTIALELGYICCPDAYIHLVYLHERLWHMECLSIPCAWMESMSRMKPACIIHVSALAQLTGLVKHMFHKSVGEGTSSSKSSPAAESGMADLW